MSVFKCTKCKGIHEKGYKCNVKTKHKKEQDKYIQNSKWRRLRLYIIDRDNCMCQRCYNKYNIINSNDLTVHHIKSRHYYPELIYDEDNLVTICRQCNSYLGDDKPLDFKWSKKDITYTL